MMLRSRGVGPATGLMLTWQMAGAFAAQAQGVFRTAPVFSLTELHESNVFSTPFNPESDFVTRISPGIASEYRAPLWTMSGQYWLEIERYANHADLNSMNARQHATVAVAHAPTSRFAWTAGAELWTTRTPGELNQATGLTFTRAAARRVSASSSLTRHFNPVTSGTAEYIVTHDHLTGGAGALIHNASASVERRRSSRETTSLDYRVRQFEFLPTAAAAASRVGSHAVLLGWTRAVTATTRVAIDAGPRVTKGSAAVELSTSVHYQRAAAELSLAYGRSQTTVIGLAGVADIQSLSATGAWPLAWSIHMRAGPSLFRTASGGARADAYVLALDFTRPIAHGVVMEVALNAGLQRGTLSAQMATTTIARRDMLIRFRAGTPSPRQ
jgi:hypothetical protein